MERKSERPTQARVKELLHYDPQTGIFTRRKPSRSGPKERKYGQVGAGRISELGYVMIMVDGINYSAGLLACLYEQGEWPSARIKYINGNKLDNRIENIRVQDVPKAEIKNRLLTLDRLKELLHYEPETGWFTWRVSSSIADPGDRAGGGHGQGYRSVGVDYNKYLEHVLAWLYMTGAWPSGEVDHINGAKSDNRWLNLRDATKSQNGYNKNLNPRNTTGIPGVNRHGNKYRVRVWDDGKVIDLGCYLTLEEAAAVRAEAEKKYVGEFKRKPSETDDSCAMYAMSEVNGMVSLN